MTKYKITLCWSNEDGTFLAQIPKLPGCATESSPHEEVPATDEWLETARELGRLIP